MKTIRLISVFITGASTIGCLAVVGSAQVINPTEDVTVPAMTAGQYSKNPGATALERADNPFNDDAYESIGMRQDRLLEQQGATYGYHGRKGAIDVALDTIAETSSVARMLGVNATVSLIQSADYDIRHQIQKYVIARVAAGDEALQIIIQRGSDRLTGETRAHALRAEQRGEAELTMSLRAASHASPDDWAQARAELASSYERYADAVIHVESVATGRVASAGGVPPAGSLLASAR